MSHHIIWAVCLCAVCGVGSAAVAQSAFQQMDANRDGVLSPSEFLAVFSTLTLSEFAALDRNADGFIDVFEAGGGTGIDV